MITKKDVRHIAELSRIELTADEEERYQKDLAGILAFVEKLNEAGTANIAPMTGGTRLENIIRKDHARAEALEQKSIILIRAAPQKKERWISVPSVFKE